MTEAHWILLTAIAAGLVGRVAKLVPSFPKSALPWLVLAAGYSLSFGMALYGGAEVSSAAVSAWHGLAAGLVAVGGHEALKPALARILGPTLARVILGKLPPAPASKGGDK